MSVNIYAKKTRQRMDPTGLDRSIEQIRATVNDHNLASAPVARAALSMESLRDDEVNALSSAVNQLEMSLESIAVDLGISASMSRAQKEAGVIAGLIAGDVNSFLSHPVTHNAISTESMSVVAGSGISDSFSKRSLAMEAYDEKDNRNAVVYSIAYNMQAARQDEFGEAFFPTVVVSPDNIGFAVSVRLFQVFNDFQRNISGALDNYEKKNIIRAVIDHTILKNEMTKIVPVFRAESADKFVPVATIPSRTIMLEGEPIVTSPLATGKRLSLLGISQTDVLLANGIMDVTDSIDPAVVLANIYVNIGGDILSFSTQNLPLSTFSPAAQGLARQMNLVFNSSSLLITKDTKQVDGSPLVALAPIVSGDLIVRLNVNVTGSVNVELADTIVYGNGVDVNTVQNSAGELLALSAAPATDVVAALAGATVIGYDLTAFRTNLNRRQRGQLIDTTVFTQMYPVPLRSPITSIRPMTNDGQTDSSDLAALIIATHIRTSNAAVGALLNAANILNEYVDARDTAGVGPDVLGVGRFLVRPTFFKANLDVAASISSLTSHERAQDIQAVLVNQIRDFAYRMYRDSGYKAAADAQSGGMSKTPTVIIGTDPVLSRYLMVEGDLRTLGSDFDVRIVTTLDSRMSGRIAMAFGVFDGSSENTPNALTFGNMAWKPELTLVLPISRGGQTSKELTVQPSFLHVVNTPIMGMIEVTNVPAVAVAQIPLYTKVV